MLFQVGCRLGALIALPKARGRGGGVTPHRLIGMAVLAVMSPMPLCLVPPVSKLWHVAAQCCKYRKDANAKLPLRW